jgi:hypothetical protein
MNRSPDLPNDVKERLLELARRLPEPSRGGFLTRVTDRLRQLSLDYSETIIFTAVGWLLGEILDHVITLHVPFADVAVCLSGGRLSSVGMVAGFLLGLTRDIQKERARAEVARVIGEELRRVLGLEVQS